MAIATAVGNQPTPLKTQKVDSDFPKRLGKAQLRRFNYLTVPSGAIMMSPTSSIIKSMDFTKILDYQGYLRCSVLLYCTVRPMGGENPRKSRKIFKNSENARNLRKHLRNILKVPEVSRKSGFRDFS